MVPRGLDRKVDEDQRRDGIDVYADRERFRVLSKGRRDGNRRVYRLGLRSDGESHAVSVRSDGNRVA